MEQRISLVTLGVADLARARTFYEALGWTSNSKPEDGVVFFQAGGMVLGLWSRRRSRRTAGSTTRVASAVSRSPTTSRSREEVDATLQQAEHAGAWVTRPGAETFWGGYSGVFLDPDGHPWEVAHNPGWSLGDDGSVSLSS